MKNLTTSKNDHFNEILTANEIKGALILGDISGLEDPRMLQEKNIKAVLTICEHDELKLNTELIKHHKAINALDAPFYKISDHFEDCFNFIEENRCKGYGVYVHCIAGKSRSASIVIAYLMKSQKIGLNESLKDVQSKRVIAQPNLGFMAQLRKYEKSILA